MRRTIALTRATEDAERSKARLLELGYASFVAPATMVLATQAGIPRCDYDAVVATSAKPGWECPATFLRLEGPVHVRL